MASQYSDALKRINSLAHHASDADYLGQATRWSKCEWIRAEPMKYRGRRNKPDLDGLVRHADFLRGRPEVPVTRKSVIEGVWAAGGNPELLEQAFIVAMTWGFRPNSYGPYRTSVMLSGTKDGRTTGALLAELGAVLSSCGDESYLTAYSAMSRKLEMCGPSFGTKWLYFASPSPARAPILDAVVAEWLARHEVDMGSRPLSAAAWNKSNYRHYLEFCRAAADVIGTEDLGKVEYLMFTDQQYFEYTSQEGNFPAWIRSVEN